MKFKTRLRVKLRIMEFANKYPANLQFLRSALGNCMWHISQHCYSKYRLYLQMSNTKLFHLSLCFCPNKIFVVIKFDQLIWLNFEFAMLFLQLVGMWLKCRLLPLTHPGGLSRLLMSIAISKPKSCMYWYLCSYCCWECGLGRLLPAPLWVACMLLVAIKEDTYQYIL